MTNIPILLARGEEALYYAALADGRLTYQVCSDCGEKIWYPRTVCPFCMSANLEQRESAGLGTVYAYTTLYRAGHASRRDDLPYSVTLVDLDEGMRVLGNLQPAAESVDPIGLRVVADLKKRNPGVTALTFTFERATV